MLHRQSFSSATYWTARAIQEAQISNATMHTPTAEYTQTNRGQRCTDTHSMSFANAVLLFRSIIAVLLLLFKITVVDALLDSILPIVSLSLPLLSPPSAQNNPSVPPLLQLFGATPPTVDIAIVDSVLAIVTSWLLVSTQKDACKLQQRRFSQAQRRKGHRCSHPEQHRGTTIQLTNVPCTGTLNHTTTPTPPAASLVSSPRWPRTTDQASFFTTPILHTRLNGK